MTSPLQVAVLDRGALRVVRDAAESPRRGPLSTPERVTPATNLRGISQADARDAVEVLNWRQHERDLTAPHLTPPLMEVSNQVETIELA